MNIKRPVKKSSKIFKYILLLLVIILIIGAVFFLTRKFSTSNQPHSDNGPTPEQQKEMQTVNNENKKQFAETTKDVDNPGTQVPIPSSPDTIELNTVKSDAKTVTVSTKLKNYADGTCKLTVTNGTKSYSNSAQILYQPEYSTCAGFSVPVSTLGVGTWTISLEVTPLGGKAITKSINFEVQ